MPTPLLIKTTQDGRKLEVVGLAILLGGKLEAIDLDLVESHPQRLRILARAPDATHMAGRVALTADEAAVAQKALDEAHALVMASPVAIQERYRLAHMWRATEQGIE